MTVRSGEREVEGKGSEIQRHGLAQDLALPRPCGLQFHSFSGQGIDGLGELFSGDPPLNS